MKTQSKGVRDKDIDALIYRIGYCIELLADIILGVRYWLQNTARPVKQCQIRVTEVHTFDRAVQVCACLKSLGGRTVVLCYCAKYGSSGVLLAGRVNNSYGLPKSDLYNCLVRGCLEVVTPGYNTERNDVDRALEGVFEFAHSAL